MTENNYKLCSRCMVVKQTSEFGFSSRYKDGVQYWCKECHARYHMERKGKIYYPPAPIGYKRCTKCHELFEANADNFQCDKSKPDGFRPVCKDCTKKDRQEKYRDNPEKYREQAKRGRLKNPDKYRETSKRFRLANPELYREYRKKWAENNPEKDKETKQKWERNNPDKVREKGIRHRLNNPEVYLANKHKRRSKENELPYEMTQTDWNFMFEYWDNKCCVCGREASGNLILARDHWIPVQDRQNREVGTIPENMLPLCHSTNMNQGGCNNSKSNKDPIEWLYSRYSKEDADKILNAIEQYFDVVRQDKNI